MTTTHFVADIELGSHRLVAELGAGKRDVVWRKKLERALIELVCLLKAPTLNERANPGFHGLQIANNRPKGFLLEPTQPLLDRTVLFQVIVALTCYMMYIFEAPPVRRGFALLCQSILVSAIRQYVIELVEQARPVVAI